MRPDLSGQRRARNDPMMNPDPLQRPPAESIESERPSGEAVPAGAAVAAPTLDMVLSELRRLAILALDAGHPLAAAQIATTADRVEAEARRNLPRRPTYGT